MTKMLKGCKLIKQAKIGDVWFNVYVSHTSDDVCFSVRWHPEGNNWMKLGLVGITDWSEAYERLLHEATEAAIRLLNGTFYPQARSRDYPQYLHFMFNHEIFQQAMTDVAHFTMAVSPEYYKEVAKKYPNLKRFLGE